MYMLGGKINRDEIIIGVLACENDKDVDILQKTARQIRTIREGGVEALKNGIKDLMRKNNLESDATLGNYTRFPISALKWTNWAVAETNKSIYNKSLRFLRLTDLGQRRAASLMNIPDVRLGELNKYDERARTAFVVLSNLQKLSMIGFDLGTYSNCLAQLQTYCQSILTDYNIVNNDYLFFGYQEATKELLKKGDDLLNVLL